MYVIEEEEGGRIVSLSLLITLSMDYPRRQDREGWKGERGLVLTYGSNPEPLR